MGDSFFKVVIRDPLWDVRTQAKSFGFLYQLFVDAKKPTEVFIKYKSVKDAVRARAGFAANENVVRVESMETWDIRPKKPVEKKQSDDTVSCAGSTTSRITSYQQRPPVAIAAPLMSEPLPMMMGLFNMCCSCRKGGAAFQCFICGTYYCGEICQRNDWPAHIVKCLPRLVRTHTGFVPNEPQPMGFPDLHMMQPFGNLNHNNTNDGSVKFDRQQQVSNQAAKSKEKQPNLKQGNNNRPGTSSKSSEQQQNPTEALPSKVTPACTVPTNVLKNLALKRNKEQETMKPAVAAKDESRKAEATAGNATKPTSKLVKRVQQKAEPIREIRHSSFPHEGEYVKITYVTDNMLYVYRSGQEANGQANRYLDFVKRSVECSREVKQTLRMEPCVNSVAFAPFDGDYYRAVVKSHEDGARVKVFFPDFGNTQIVEWKEMKAIPQTEIQYHMCYTHGVKIDGVATFSPLGKHFLSELLEQEEFELTKVSDDKDVKTVDMRHVQELYQLSAKLLELAKKEQETAKANVKPAANETVTVLDPASYVPVIAEQFEDAELPVGREILLTIVEASELNISNQISVILVSDNEAFGKVVSDCDRYGNMDSHPYHPVNENEAFLLQYDGIWCRAMLAGSSGDQQYYMIDLGIIRTLDEPPKYRRYPAGMTLKTFVTECFVDNMDALGALEVGGNNEQLLGKTLKATAQPGNDDEGTRLKIHSIEG